MVVELIALAVAVIGSFAAGLWDLRTTDVPDEITTLMAILGPLLWTVHVGITGDVVPLALSLIAGTIVLIFGWLLYRGGQWGGGDAKLFAAIFYLLGPDISFGIDYIINLLFVALAYLVIYSLCLGAKHPKAFAMAANSLKRRAVKAGLGIYALVLVLGALLAQLYGMDFTIAIAYWLIGLGLILFWAYAKAIEKGVFRKTIPAKELKAGDVLASFDKWEGITEAEAAKIRKSKKTVEVKEGVRFTLVFALNILVTLFVGNVAFLLLV
jgi:Flp pilus assembly protein protease CpaA